MMIIQISKQLVKMLLRQSDTQTTKYTSVDMVQSHKLVKVSKKVYTRLTAFAVINMFQGIKVPIPCNNNVK